MNFAELASGNEAEAEDELELEDEMSMEELMAIETDAESDAIAEDFVNYYFAQVATEAAAADVYNDLFGDLDDPPLSGVVPPMAPENAQTGSSTEEDDVNWKLILGGDGTLGGHFRHSHGVKFNETQRRKWRKQWRSLPLNNTVRMEIVKARDQLSKMTREERIEARTQIIQLNRMKKFERGLKNITHAVQNGEDVEHAIETVKHQGEKLQPGVVATAKAEVKAKDAETAQQKADDLM